MIIDKVKLDNKRVIEILKLIQIEVKRTNITQTGICKSFYSLSSKQLATYSEIDFVKKFLLKNKPTKRNKYKHFTNNKYWLDAHSNLYSYWWDEIYSNPETRQIRIDYLQELIDNIK